MALCCAGNKETIKKKRYAIHCPTCKRLISCDSNENAFRVEVRCKEHEDDYDKVTRCPRCRTWLGAFR